MQQSFPRFTAEFCRHSWSNIPQNLWFFLSWKIWESFFSTNYRYRSWSGTLISFFPDPGSNQKTFGFNMLLFLVNWLKFSVPVQNIEQFSNIVKFMSTRRWDNSPPIFCCCWSGIPDLGWRKIRIRDKNPGSVILVKLMTNASEPRRQKSGKLETALKTTVCFGVTSTSGLGLNPTKK
jgi:hypothetical protein